MSRYYGGPPAALSTVTAFGSRSDVMTGTSYKSFPGMARDTINFTNRLHLVYRSGTAHNSALSTIDYKYSDDDGATWSNPGSAQTIVTSAGSNDVRDPFILVSSTGRIIVGYDYRHPYSSTNIEVQIIYSDDGGGIWSSGYVIPATLTGTEAAGTSQPIQLGNGDILIPGTIENGGPLLSVLWKSTDDGATFPTQVTIASDGAREYTEPQMRLLASGDIVCLMRSDTTQHTYRSVSTDSGATWSSPPTDVLTASSRPDFVEISPGLLLLFCRNNNSQFYARWTYSTDAGLTWAPLANVDGVTDVSMYAAPVVTSPGHVTVVYSLENSASDADLYLRHYVSEEDMIFHGVRVYRTATQSLTSGVYTTIAFTAEEYDTDAFHSNVSDNSRLTVPPGLPGYYHIFAALSFTGNTTGQRLLIVQHNGDFTTTGDILVPVSESGPGSAGDVHMVLTTVRPLSAGDYIELRAYQNSGGPLNAEIGSNAGNYVPSFGMHWLGPL